MDDTIYLGNAYTKLLSQLILVKNVFAISISYIKNVLFRNFRVVMLASRAAGSSAFFSFISIVFSKGSKKQMGRIYTPRIVALMANTKILWDYSVMYVPRVSMGGTEFLAIPVFSIITRSGTSPFPAFMKWNHFNVFPKVKLISIHEGVI